VVYDCCTNNGHTPAPLESLAMDGEPDRASRGQLAVTSPYSARHADVWRSILGAAGRKKTASSPVVGPPAAVVSDHRLAVVRGRRRSRLGLISASPPL